MSDDGDSTLVLRAEAALERTAVPEPDWDAFATRVEAALGTASAIDDSLFMPPLPESVEDEHEALATRASDEREAQTAPSSQQTGPTLADLARATVARRSSKDAVDLAKASLAIASQGRALPEVPRRAEPEAPAAVAAVPTSERERNTVPPARRERAAVDTRGPWIGVAIAAVGLAAGFGLYLASRPPPRGVATAPASVTSPTQTTPTPSTPAAPTVAVKTETPAEPRIETPEVFPIEKEAAAAPLPSPAAEAGAHSAASAKAPAVEARSTAAASTGRARPTRVVLEEDSAPAAPSTPPKPALSAMRPAELNSTSGGMSDRPSTGAAQAAVGAVLGAARSCVAGQPQASSATIVFGSSGEVTNVNVSGPAEGTPAASCIKGALGKARVQPFAASNFSLGVTVRPL